MFTHKTTSGYATDEGNVIAATATHTGSTEVGYDGTVAATTDNQEVDIAWLHANVQSLVIYSSATLTVKTNSSGSPTQTLSIAAGQAIVWGVGNLEVNPVTADVTKLFLSNDTSGIATVKIRVLVT